MKYNEELLAHFKNKHLGYMTSDAQKNVEVTDRGFVYKGELIVAIEGLKDMIVEKVPLTVGDLENKGVKRDDSVAKLTTDVTKLTDEKDEKVVLKRNDPRVVKAVNVSTVPAETVKKYVDEAVKAVEEEKKEETKPAPKRRGPKPKK